MNEPNLTQLDEPETAVPTQNQPIATLSERMILFIIALLSIGADQTSKFLVEANLDLFEVYAPIPSLEAYFRFFHISNTGAAFGLFEGAGGLFRYLAIIVSLGIIYYNQVLPGRQRLLRLALGLQMGGALGNMIDRFRIGHVTDFIDIGPWYIFNLADLSVVTGAIILGWLLLQESRELRAAQKQEIAAQQETAQTEPAEVAILPQMDSDRE
ncbi:Lipoprotein signal peptidase [hydrothermal vent metagenome]|uniref:Lipoprotein signal peptidase n=1 Tax=hydrothermal vent metagenome TaxID=652676 RepID=A0A3B0V2K1_9ZZZZ